MPEFLDKLVDRMMVWSLRTSKARRFDGIGLVDFRGRGDSFAQVIECSLRLVQEHDARRYARIRKHIAWIVNQINSEAGAQYQPSIRACFMQFEEAPELQRDVFIAFHACILVHEATHGVIGSRGIEMTAENSVRIERLCTTEQNRFSARLSDYDPARYPRELLQFKFDEGYWAPEWKKSGSERGASFIKRWFSDRNTG